MRLQSGFIKGAAFAFILVGIGLLLSAMLIRHAVPFLNQWMVANALRNMGFGS